MIGKAKDYWSEMGATFNALSSRERGIAAATVGTVLVIVFGQFFWYPKILSIFDAMESIAVLERSRPAQESTLAELVRREQQDPNAALRSKLTELKRAIVLQEKAYFEQLSHLVTPAEMVSVLYDVLGSSENIKLLSLENLPVEAVFEQEGEGVGQGLYRHGVRVEFEANYFDTIGYLERLEQAGDRLIFKSLHYRVDNYPMARVVVVVETLGMESEWLGV